MNAPTDYPLAVEYLWPYKVHYLKTVDPYFDAVERRHKRFEVRVNDRNFMVGDLLVLRHWLSERGYTGRHVVRVADYVMPGGAFGVAAEYVVISLGSPPLDLASERVS